MTHYIADFKTDETHAYPYKAFCSCGMTLTFPTRVWAEQAITLHIMEANAVERANAKDREGRTRPNIRSRDLTRRVFEMELPLAGKLSDLVAAIGRMESHHDEVKLAAATEIEYKIEKDKLVLYYGANLG